ncbi:MAG: glutamate--tRNA ligase [Oscillospiraceae bacterium]|nr:glutamate--tRNA ligase [Oscillospiraceae bacterium]
MLDHTYFTAIESPIPTGKTRTRFAPSPTGYMHVGNLRTALYAYLIAKKAKGDFLLRIEDTDQARLVEGAMEVIYKTLADCGLTHDEGPDLGGPVGPYIQTDRKPIYAQYADLLVELGGAYRCFCDKSNPEPDPDPDATCAATGPVKYDGRCSRLPADEIAAKLAANTPYVIRQRIPEGQTTFSDLVFGQITVDNDTLDDNVLIKSDGLPTYNFANVIDDHLMGISHVVRGSEYLSSTPKYNLLYQSFGWTPPLYVHCSPVMRDATHKMSKRHGDPSYEDLIDQGYLTDAILNYVALLGWSPGGEEEIFTREQLIEVFDVKGISKSPAIFDMDKLRHFNSAYIRALSPEAFHALALPYIQQTVKNPAYDTKAIADILHQRCETLCDIPKKVDFFDTLPAYDIDLYENKKSKTDATISKSMLEAAIAAFEALDHWTSESVHTCLMTLAETLEVKNATLMYPVRIAAAGKAVTPGGAVEICAILGKPETLRRLRLGLEKLG